MRWFRANKTFGSRLALFALAVQFVLAFGHIHHEDIFGPARPAAAMAAAVPDGEETEAKPRDVKWDDPEPLVGGSVDLGAFATEFLMLGLDPYPRKPGAIFEPPQDRKPDEGPFAALSKLTKG